MRDMDLPNKNSHDARTWEAAGPQVFGCTEIF